METEIQWIEGWSATDDDRLVGAVHSGQSGLRTIVTSPVVRVTFVGDLRTPVAFTESGTAYSLKNPGQTFGAHKAEKFFQRLSTEGRSPQVAHDLDNEQTLVLQPPVRRPK